MKIESWQIEEAQAKKTVWHGDLNDDCTANWAGFLLRAELMSENHWWWAISDLETNEELDSSNNYDGVTPSTGKEARRLAESAACDFLGLKYQGISKTN